MNNININDMEKRFLCESLFKELSEHDDLKVSMDYGDQWIDFNEKSGNMYIMLETPKGLEQDFMTISMGCNSSDYSRLFYIGIDEDGNEYEFDSYKEMIEKADECCMNCETKSKIDLVFCGKCEHQYCLRCCRDGFCGDCYEKLACKTCGEVCGDLEDDDEKICERCIPSESKEEEEEEVFLCCDCDVELDSDRDGDERENFRCNNCYWEDQRDGDKNVIKPDYRYKKEAVYTKHESEKFKYIIERLMRQDSHKTDEILHDILTDKLWDMSENVMNYGTDEEKSLMKDWAKDCEMRWNNGRWANINDDDDEEEEEKEEITELKKKIDEYEAIEQYIMKTIRNGGEYDDILKAHYREGKVVDGEWIDDKEEDDEDD